MFKNALVSVSDKTGLVEFLKSFADLRIVSTGGTAKHLKDAGLKVIEVSEQTQFPEVMDGRVRTLHPFIHMPLLAREENIDDMNLLKEYNLSPFDLVVGNLYPFSRYKDQELSDRELTEYIDIGGPALLRAAAKNFQQITVVSDPEDYEWIATDKQISLEKRKYLAAKVFAHISSYDAIISQHFGGYPLQQKFVVFGGELVQPLRYGENPHQDANWYKDLSAKQGLHHAKILSGKALSYNNILDIDSAVGLLREFRSPTTVIVKHNNPCAASKGEECIATVKKAIESDPVSMFGGIVAMNRPVTIEIANLLSPIFLECIVAPEYMSDALEKLQQKKNIRLLEWKGFEADYQYDLRSISGGYLMQTKDQIDFEWNSSWTIHGEQPNEQIKKDLLFAWRVCAHLKSNAIALVSNEQTVGLGMGQVNRIDAVQQAIERWQKNHKSKPVVLASDAFFPFADSIELAAKYNIKWVIQPGGSIKDEEVIAAAKKLKVNIIITHKRHFKH